MDVNKNAFEDAFGTESNLNAWAKVGAAPCTRACLQDKQVRRELNDSTSEDETTLLMLKLDEANELAVYNLTVAGYNASLLKAQCHKIPAKQKLTVPHSKERIALLAAASTHGAKFNATMGDHVTGDDMFRAAEVAVWDRRINVLEVKKAAGLKRRKVEEAGKAIFALNKPVATMKDSELAKLIEWHEGIPTSKQGTKAIKASLWTTIVNDSSRVPMVGPMWSEALESDLTTLKKKTLRLVTLLLREQSLSRRWS